MRKPSVVGRIAASVASSLASQMPRPVFHNLQVWPPSLFSSITRFINSDHSKKSKKEDDDTPSPSSLQLVQQQRPHSHPVQIMEEDVTEETGGNSSSAINSGALLHLSYLQKVRLLHRLYALCHCGLVALSVWGAVSASQACPGGAVAACSITALASTIRILWMIGTAVSQAAVASVMITVDADAHPAVSAKQAVSARRERRMRYVRWLWWGRLGGIVTLLQLVGAVYLIVLFVKHTPTGSNPCYTAGDSAGWHRRLFLSLALAAWVLTIMQCCMGSDILAWSSLYARHSEAWRTYYHEMFDYGIREALCCLGRAQYISAGDDDAVDSVAAVLGDLVSYQGAGAGHLEFLAGLALLQLQQPHQLPVDQLPPAPEALIQEATLLHPYAVAAYTGPLLDVGRNPLLFPCVWIHRQGVFAPWNRNRLPKLEGDNWCRGHAAAFLTHVKLPPEALRRGRVYQAKRECAYFVTVVHQLHCVVVAVRGTETPEDLLTDGLGRECILTENDLQGLLQSKNMTAEDQLGSLEPHYGHEGIIEAARELAAQLDNVSDDTVQNFEKETGLLHSLLGPGGECEGYALRFVGHSLGGSIAALTAIRLYSRYPQLHVYGYGVLPCVDPITADTCSTFITSIVYNDEFSSRLSVSSIKRLRVAAVKALASETAGLSSATVTRFARQLFGSEQMDDHAEITRTEVTAFNGQNKRNYRRYKFKLKGGIYLCSHACRCMVCMSSYSSARPVDFKLKNGMQCNSQIGKCHVILEGTYPAKIISTLEVLPCAEDIILAIENGKHVSSSSNTVTHQVADKENTCVDAGKDCCHVPEESEVLLVPDNAGVQTSFSETVETMLIDSKTSVSKDSNIAEIDEIHDNSCNGNTASTMRNSYNVQINHEICPNSPEEHFGEMFMPGLVIHVVPVNKKGSWSFWRHQKSPQHQALIADRKSFQDIVISPWMFLDHMPWRCQYALNTVLEQIMASKQPSDVPSIDPVV